jgi:hypothetical protein
VKDGENRRNSRHNVHPVITALPIKVPVVAMIYPQPTTLDAEPVRSIL